MYQLKFNPDIRKYFIEVPKLEIWNYFCAIPKRSYCSYKNGNIIYAKEMSFHNLVTTIDKVDDKRIFFIPPAIIGLHNIKPRTVFELSVLEDGIMIFSVTEEGKYNTGDEAFKEVSINAMRIQGEKARTEIRRIQKREKRNGKRMFIVA